jgi:hypothetical protein
LLVDGGAAGGQLVRGVSLRGESHRHVRISVDGGAPLSGTLQDEQGRPIAGARAILLPRDDERPWRSCVSDERGQFQLGAVTPGSYLLSAARRDLSPRAAVTISVPSAPAILRLVAASDASANAPASDADWQISVASAQNAWPLAGACALTLGGRAQVFGPASERGELRVHERAGTHLSIGAAGHRPAEVELTASATHALQAALEPCEDLHLRILNDAGEPLVRVLVVIEWSRGPSAAMAPPNILQGETNASGELELPILGEHFEARILSEERRVLGHWSGDVPAGHALSASVPRAATLDGALRGKDGQMVNDAVVWISLGDESVWGTTMTAGQGAFEFHVPPGLSGAFLEAQLGARHIKRELPTLKSGAAIVGFDLVLEN